MFRVALYLWPNRRAPQREEYGPWHPDRKAAEHWLRQFQALGYQGRIDAYKETPGNKPLF